MKCLNCDADNTNVLRVQKCWRCDRPIFVGEPIDDESWIRETVLELEQDCGECRHFGAEKEDILRRRLALLLKRNKHDSEDIANVIKAWWLEKPRSRDPGDAEYRVVYTEQVYDLMRRLS